MDDYIPKKNLQYEIMQDNQEFHIIHIIIELCI